MVLFYIYKRITKKYIYRLAICITIKKKLIAVRTVTINPCVLGSSSLTIIPNKKMDDNAIKHTAKRITILNNVFLVLVVDSKRFLLMTIAVKIISINKKINKSICIYFLMGLYSSNSFLTLIELIFTMINC